MTRRFTTVCVAVLLCATVWQSAGCATTMTPGTVSIGADAHATYEGDGPGTIEVTLANNIVDLLRDVTNAVWRRDEPPTPPREPTGE